MISIKKKDEIKYLREGGSILAETLDEVQKNVEEGVTTRYLNEIAHSAILKRGGTPSFLNYHPSGAPSPYPAAPKTP